MVMAIRKGGEEGRSGYLRSACTFPLKKQKKAAFFKRRKLSGGGSWRRKEIQKGEEEKSLGVICVTTSLIFLQTKALFCIFCSCEN